LEYLTEDLTQNGWYQAINQKMDKGFEAAVYQKAVDGKALNVALCKSTMSNVKIETIFEVYREYEKYQERFDKKKM
jgi:hypothetical protein